jgi:hypothetical protein
MPVSETYALRPGSPQKLLGFIAHETYETTKTVAAEPALSEAERVPADFRFNFPSRL